MESYEVPFREMLIRDFSYQRALLYNTANVDEIISAGYWKSKKYTHQSFFFFFFFKQLKISLLSSAYQIIPVMIAV